MSKYKHTKCRKRWLILNPPNIDGFYICALCLQEVHKTEVTIDHIKPQRLYPELQTHLSNMQPAHERCNTRRGEMIDKLILRGCEYMAKLIKGSKAGDDYDRIARYLDGVDLEPLLQNH